MSKVKYISIIFIDCFWLYAFFSAYIRGGEVSGIFTLFMFAAWYAFNMFCAFFIEDRESDEEEEDEKSSIIKDSLIRRILTFTVPKIKYLAIGIVNAIFIILMVQSYMDKGEIPGLGFIFLLIYNVFNLCIIGSTSDVKAKEFYRILLLVCPFIIGFVWMLMA